MGNEKANFWNRIGPNYQKMLGHRVWHNKVKNKSIYIEKLETIVDVNAVGKGVATINVHLNKVKVLALVDTGAAVSLVSEDFVKDAGLTILKDDQNRTYRSANQVPIDTLGMVKCEVRIGKSLLKETFIVAKKLATKVILGVEFLKINKMDILFSENCIMVLGEKVPIGTSPQKVVSGVDDWRPSDEANINSDNLNPAEIDKVKSLMDEYADIFSKNDEDIGSADFIHKIELIDKTPVRSRAYRIPHTQKVVVADEIAKMLRIGVIQRSQSDYASPIVLVKKQDGSNRFCIDFRKLNEFTVKDSYPMPLIEEKLEGLAGKKYFTSLDLTSGYWQFMMEPGSRKLTAFISHEGMFEFVRMPSVRKPSVRKLLGHLSTS